MLFRSVVDAAVTRSQAGMSRRRWWPLVFPALTVAALYAAATFGRPAGLDAFPWTIAATLIFYGATFTTVARGMRAMLYLPLVNATLLVYPDFYKVNTCHALRHLNTVMIEASRLGSRFVDHPDDLFVWTDGGNPREVLTTPCYAGIATTDFTTSFRSIAHRRLGEFTDENPFADEEDDEGHVALVTATDDGYARFVERMRPHGVQLEIMASYQDPPSGLHIYILLFTQDRRHTP